MRLLFILFLFLPLACSGQDSHNDLTLAFKDIKQEIEQEETFL